MANDNRNGQQGQQSPTVFVTVGCKLPHGLIMELIPKHDGWNPPPCGPRVTLNGANSVKRDSILRVTPRVLEYGRTQVDKSFWEQWLVQHKNDDMVKKGFVFAEQKVSDFKAHAKEALPEKTGLEGLNPTGADERLKKTRVPGSPETVVETDTEHLKRLREQMGEEAA